MRVVFGALAYEFRMQCRRPAMWMVMLAVEALTVVVTKAPFHAAHMRDATPAVAQWDFWLEFLTPAVFGCLLADRLPRDRRLRVDELWCALPAAPGRRLVGKYLGAALATMLPVLAAYAAGVLVLAARFGTTVLGPALAMFLTVNLPGLLFVAAFSIGCPAVMPVPLYQFLFVGYWFWGNFLSPKSGIPTLSGTILTPAGGFALSAFFRQPGAVIPAGAPVWQGVASIAVLLGGAALALGATTAYLRRQRAAP